jgi:hypothetical protein
MTESNLGDPILFYDGAITLRFDKENHAYHLMLEDGTTEIQDGVTTISNILDHSFYLLPWACKMMYLKLLRTIPRTIINSTECVYLMWEPFDKILQEAKSAHREYFMDAGDVGNMAHAWLEESIKTAIRHNDGIVERPAPQTPADERAVNCGMAAFKWMQAHNVRWLHTERKIYSRKWKYAGTMDGLATVDSCDNPACCHKFFMDQLSLIDWKSSNHLRIEYLYQTAAYQNAQQEEFGQEILARWILRLGKEDGEFEAWYETDFAKDFETFLACLQLHRLNREVDKRMRDTKKLKTFYKREAKKAAKPKKEKKPKQGAIDETKEEHND